MPPRLTKRAPAAKAKAGKSAKAIAKLLTDPKSVLATADLYVRLRPSRLSQTSAFSLCLSPQLTVSTRREYSPTPRRGTS